MVLWLLVVAILGACAPSTDAETAVPSITTEASPDLTGAALVFEDEFSGERVDETKWNIVSRTIGYTGAFSAINPAMVSIVNGHLMLEVQQVPWLGQAYSGGEVTSQNKFSQRYGYFEARIKIPSGVGIHSTWWLYPSSDEWPPEIDIAEFKGSGTTNVYLTNHWFDPSADRNDAYDSTTYTGPDFSADFHVFGLSWTPDALTWYVDGIVRATQTNHVPTIPMVLVLDNVLDGFGGGYDPATRLPAAMCIDYVRVYETMTLATPNGLEVR